MLAFGWWLAWDFGTEARYPRGHISKHSTGVEDGGGFFKMKISDFYLSLVCRKLLGATVPSNGLRSLYSDYLNDGSLRIHVWRAETGLAYLGDENFKIQLDRGH